MGPGLVGGGGGGGEGEGDIKLYTISLTVNFAYRMD